HPTPDTGGYGNGILAHSRHASDLLPNVADDFAADAFLAGLAVAHQAPRGGKDGDAQAPQHAGNLILLGINPQAGAAYPAQTGDDPLLAGPVLQVQPEHALLVIIDPLEVVNEALFLQNLGESPLHSGPRDIYLFVIGRVGIADSRQEIRNGIRHRHGMNLLQLLAAPAASITSWPS